MNKRYLERFIDDCIRKCEQKRYKIAFRRLSDKSMEYIILRSEKLVGSIYQEIFEDDEEFCRLTFQGLKAGINESKKFKITYDGKERFVFHKMPHKKTARRKIPKVPKNNVENSVPSTSYAKDLRPAPSVYKSNHSPGCSISSEEIHRLIDEKTNEYMSRASEWMDENDEDIKQFLTPSTHGFLENKLHSYTESRLSAEDIDQLERIFFGNLDQDISTAAPDEDSSPVRRKLETNVEEEELRNDA